MMNLMTNPTLYIQLSETEKRVLFVIFLAVIFILILIGAIGYLIQKVMKYQAKKIEHETFDAVKFGVVKEKKHFTKYAKRKNNQIFIKQAWLPLLIVAFGFIVLIIYDCINGMNFKYNPFNRETGFASLLWIWDFDNPDNYSKFFGITLLSQFPALKYTPEFHIENWGGYLFVPCVFIGGFWYLITVQGYFARLLKIRSITDKVFGKTFDNFVLTPDNTVNNQNPPQNPNQNVNNG